MIEISTCDFLAGGGGVTYAMRTIPGVKCKWVLNHDPIAIRTNMYNNKGIKHYYADFYNQDEHELEPVDFVWISIECPQHSGANAEEEKEMGSYTLGFEMIRYMEYLRPLVIGIENVPEFKKWAPVRIVEDKSLSNEFQCGLALYKKGKKKKSNQFYRFKPIKERQGEMFKQWKKAICDMGYDYHEKICNAADFGLPTRRKRYFAYFTKKELEMDIPWPIETHNQKGNKGLEKWVACRPHINLENEGHSIFGRELNPDIKKGHRRPLVKNSTKRIAGGIKKLCPEMWFILQYYGGSMCVQTLEAPLNTITTKDRHALIKLEKAQFIQDYCRGDIYTTPDQPINTQLTWQTKHLVTLEKRSFISDASYSNNETTVSLDEPINTLTTQERKQLVQASINFVSVQNNSNGNPGANNHSIDSPLWTISTEQKFQFITAYFNSGGNPESQNQSLEHPLGSILTATNKKALITALQNGEIDFDIKMRFLEPEELGACSTFPKGYFTDPRLKLSKKEATRLIGNAVPPEWARIIIKPVIEKLREVLSKKNAA